MKPHAIPNYRHGGREPEPVWVVDRREIDAVLGTQSVGERVKVLRGIRDLGLLRHSTGRLTARVRTGEIHPATQD